MKRLYCIIFFLVLCIAGPAGAIPIPFQVGTNGTLEETVTSGPGLIGGYTALGTDVFYLAQGETSGVIDFFNVRLPLALGAGTVTASIDLLSPTPLADVENTGLFKAFSIIFLSWGELTWPDAVQIPYSYNGMDNGLLTLNLFDITAGLQCGSGFTISGTITNSQSPTATPIPPAVLLFGTGLIGLVGFRKKNR